jgi:hypothetical protein
VLHLLLDAGDEQNVTADRLNLLFCPLLGRAARWGDAAFGSGVWWSVCPYEGHFTAHDEAVDREARVTPCPHMRAFSRPPGAVLRRRRRQPADERVQLGPSQSQSLVYTSQPLN